MRCYEQTLKSYINTDQTCWFSFAVAMPSCDTYTHLINCFLLSTRCRYRYRCSLSICRCRRLSFILVPQRISLDKSRSSLWCHHATIIRILYCFLLSTICRYRYRCIMSMSTVLFFFLVSQKIRFARNRHLTRHHGRNIIPLSLPMAVISYPSHYLWQ